MKYLHKIIIGFALLIVCHNLNAQISLGIYGSIAQPLEKTAEIAQSGKGWGVSASYKPFGTLIKVSEKSFTRNLQLGIGYNQITFEGKSSSIMTDIGAVKASFSDLKLTGYWGTLTYFLLRKKIQPYIAFDAGYFKASGTATAFNITLNRSEENYGIAPNAGCLFKITQHLAADLTIKYNLVFGNSQGDAKWIPVNLGFVYVFGNK
jgi:hypothetical protein